MGSSPKPERINELRPFPPALPQHMEQSVADTIFGNICDHRFLVALWFFRLVMFLFLFSHNATAPYCCI